jgi:predicted neuraminidase
MDFYVAFFRSRFADFIYKSVSIDGCQWTPPVRTTLPNNNASIQAAMVADHHIVLAFDNSRSSEISSKPKEGPRKPLAVALSIDNGYSWKWIYNVEPGRSESDDSSNKNIESREEHPYPTIVQDPDGQIDLAFTFRRETIKFFALF